MANAKMRIAIGQFNELTDEKLTFAAQMGVKGVQMNTPLLPGDIIFCGTPAGVGVGRDPKRFIQPGEELVSHVEGVGELRQKFVAA